MSIMRSIATGTMIIVPLLGFAGANARNFGSHSRSPLRIGLAIAYHQELSAPNLQTACFLTPDFFGIASLASHRPLFNLAPPLWVFDECN
jgi:hypothetical protein